MTDNSLAIQRLINASGSLLSRWIKVGVTMYLQSTFMNLTLYKFKLHKP